MTKTYVSLVITYLLNVVDYFQTIYAINTFGIGVESNPIARWAITNGNAELFKLVLPFVLLAALGAIIKFDKRCAWAAYVLLVSFTLLVLHNFGILLRLGAVLIVDATLLTTLCIVLAIVLVICAIIIGGLLAYCKHLKRK